MRGVNRVAYVNESTPKQIHKITQKNSTEIVADFLFSIFFAIWFVCYVAQKINVFWLLLLTCFCTMSMIEGVQINDYSTGGRLCDAL